MDEKGIAQSRGGDEPDTIYSVRLSGADDLKWRSIDGAPYFNGKRCREILYD
jgi:hypothetical protein